MLEHSIYSVISREGCGAILWNKNSSEVTVQEYEKAAEALKITAQDLYGLKVTDEVIPEPIGGAHRDPKEAASLLAKILKNHLLELMSKPYDVLLEERYRKFRVMGSIKTED
jgi:acetyl-CoA carboxylase carboxyl transferase subunit alpha